MMTLRIVFAVMAALACAVPAARAQSALTQRDVQVIVRALGFLQPPPGDGVVGVIFASGNAESRSDAERVAALFGDGLRAGPAMLRARAISADKLDASGPLVALVALAGAPVDTVMAAAQTRKIACVTAVLEHVQAARCALWVRSEPRVEVVISQNGARNCGIGFAAAFRMMVREI